MTADLFVTVDGYAKGKDAPAYFGLYGPDLGRWIDAEMAVPQCLLMGRVTYETLSAAAVADPSDSPDRMTELPKVICSTTLDEPLAWANSRITRDAVSEVRTLKSSLDVPLRTFGSLSIVSTLVAADLVDRLRLVVFPLALGESGREPALAGLPDVDLELLSTETLDGRLVVLEYRPHRR
ncbi:dihydrofolate reductase family protein [Euzebya pacifica]|uniref:dihydrofolate reductase family protein n=1 Tax=Euzebya pacifica TaxID=1608957 RepID=UPI0030F91C88